MFSWSTSVVPCHEFSRLWSETSERTQRSSRIYIHKPIPSVKVAMTLHRILTFFHQPPFQGYSFYMLNISSIQTLEEPAFSLTFPRLWEAPSFLFCLSSQGWDVPETHLLLWHSQFLRWGFHILSLKMHWSFMTEFISYLAPPAVSHSDPLRPAAPDDWQAEHPA